MTEPLLTAHQVGHTVRGRTILTDVSLDVRPGERVALTGPSGSGKTTLLTILAGLIAPTTGTVLLAGRPVTAPASRGRITLVLQGYGLIGLLTAAENVEVALRASGHRPADAMRIAARTLESLGMDPFADHLVDRLSGGQQQRVAVARGLALRPVILLADEPTAEQDAEHEEVVLRQVLNAEDAAAVVIATHDPDVAKRCDRVLTLTDGRQVHTGADSRPLESGRTDR
ncbi:MAG: ABC transporter ATP-binding protein [Actinomycetes bacterium]